MYSAILFFLATQATLSFAAVQTLTQNGECLQVSGTPSDGSAVVMGSCNENNGQRESTGQQWVSEMRNLLGHKLLFCCAGLKPDHLSGEQ